MTKFAHIYLVMTTSLTALGILLIGYWNFWPETIVTVKNPTSVAVNKESYNAGDRLTYTLDYCKKRQLVATVNRAIVDGFRLNFEPTQSDLEEGCHVININELVIPDFLPSGTYHIDDTAIYKVNPLRDFTLHFRTVDFKVVNLSNDETQLQNHEEQDTLKFEQINKALKK